MISTNDGTFRKWGGKNTTLGQFVWPKKIFYFYFSILKTMMITSGS
jgi:hypothetical protein